MAEEGFEAVKSLLNCSVCLERYTDPRNLDCRHNFCLKCLEALVGRNQICCPMCRAITHIANGDVTSLKHDSTIASLISIAQQREQDLNVYKECGVCKEITHLLNICKACQISLCKICSRTHARFFNCVAEDLVSIKLFEEQAKFKAQVQENIMSIQTVVTDCQLFSKKTFNLANKRDTLKSNIQLHVDDILRSLEVKKVNLFDEVDKYFDGQTEKVEHNKAEIHKQIILLNVLLDNLKTLDVEATSEIEAQLSLVADTLKDTTEYLETFSTLTEESSNIVFDKKIVDNIDLGSICEEKKGESRSEATFQFVVENFSKMDKSVLSPQCMVRNMPWKIKAMSRNTNTARHSLGFYLQCNGDTESTAWSCHASAELRMLKWDPEGEPCKKKIQHLFHHKEKDWGFNCFKLWKDVVDPSNGYIKDDKVILEAHVTADALHGVSGSLKRGLRSPADVPTAKFSKREQASPTSPY